MAIAFLNNITFSGGAQSEKLRLENLPSNPASGNEGQLYFNTATDKVLVYANGAWANLDGANDFLTGLSFNTGDGVLTATVSNQSNVTVDLDGRYALSSSIPGTIVESVTARTYLTNVGTASAVILDHDNTSRTDTTSSASPGSGGTVDLVNTITTNATGHVTAVDIQTVTFPTNTNETYTLPVAAGGANSAVLNLTAGGTGSGVKSSVTINGDSNTVKVTESTGNNGSVTLDLQDDVTITNDLTVGGELTVSGTGQSSFGGQVTVPTTPSAGTDAASKSYVDSLVSGGLTFKGTFRADTGEILSGDNDGSYLYQLSGSNFNPSAARVAVALGDYYVVATAGGNFYGSGGTGTCATTSFLDIGDAVIGVEVAAADASVCSDWSLISQGVVVNSFKADSANSTYLTMTPTTATTGAVELDADLSAVDGTSDTATRFLSKDNTWDVPSYTTNSDAEYALTAAAKSGSNVPLTLTGSGGGATTTVNLTEGANITLTRNSSGQITIASTDTGALGKRIVLNNALSYVGSADAGGIRTFAINVADSNVFGSGSTAINVKCEVIDASTSGDTAGQTVYADITRGVNAGGQTYGTASLNVAIIGTPANSAYEVLLTYVG